MIPNEAKQPLSIGVVQLRLSVVFVTEHHFSFQEKTEIEGTLFVYAR